MLLDYLKNFMTIEQWHYGIVALTFFIGGCALLGIPTVRYIRILRQRNSTLTDQYNLHKILLDIDARCWWNENVKTLECSTGLIELLGLNPDQPVSLQDVVNQFWAEDAYRLDQFIGGLKQNQEPFDAILTSIDDKTRLRMRGYSFGENSQRNYVINAMDVTEEDFVIDRLHGQVEQLFEDRNWYEQLTNIIPMAIWGRDEALKLTYCNQVYAGIMDTTPDVIVREGRELVDRQRHNSPYQLAQKAMAANQPQSRQIHIVVDGHRRMIDVTEIPLEGHSGTIGYAIDLTELEDVGLRLAKHIASHQQVLHNLSTPIAVYGADMRLQFFNTAYQKLLGFEEKWLYQKPLYAEVLQDLRERRKLPEYSNFTAFKEAQLQLFNTLIAPLQDLINQPDGQVLRMMIVPHPLGGLIFVFDDVTDKLAMERRYNTLIAVQKETIDHLYEGIVVLGSDNRLRLSNPAAAKLWQINDIEMEPGRHSGEILYQIRHIFKGYSDWDDFRQKTLTMFNARQPVTDRIHLKEQVMLQYSYVPLPDGSHLFSFIDVSDRWRFEQALRERNEALEQADRFKSDFISHVSYELRAPLNSIIGFSEILLNQYFGNINERQIDYCRGINDSSQRLLTLINDIIDFSSVEAGQLSLKIHPIELESLLSSLMGLIYNRSNDHGLQINYRNCTSVTTFLADERRLKQALFNLLMNAIKFTPAGGSIELSANVEEDEDGQNLCFSIQDTGIGMSEEEQQQIRKLFETNQKASSVKSNATGIGLPLVRSFIGMHGGTVAFQSELGRGTTVMCRIPLLAEPMEMAMPIHESAETVSMMS